MNFLTQLQSELSAIDLTKVKWPDTKLEDDQTVIGTASDDVLRIIGLRSRIGDEFKELRHQRARVSPPNDETRERHDQIEAQLHILADKVELVNDLLWLTVKSEHPDYAHKGRVGIAKDYQIWWDEGDKNVSRLFGEAFGNGAVIEIIGFSGFSGRG